MNLFGQRCCICKVQYNKNRIFTNNKLSYMLETKHSSFKNWFFFISVPPATVTIDNVEDVVLVVGSKVEISCRSGGSRPHATITWWIDNNNLQGVKIDKSKIVSCV